MKQNQLISHPWKSTDKFTIQETKNKKWIKKQKRKKNELNAHTKAPHIWGKPLQKLCLLSNSHKILFGFLTFRGKNKTKTARKPYLKKISLKQKRKKNNLIKLLFQKSLKLVSNELIVWVVLFNENNSDRFPLLL